MDRKRLAEYVAYLTEVEADLELIEERLMVEEVLLNGLDTDDINEVSQTLGRVSDIRKSREAQLSALPPEPPKADPTEPEAEADADPKL